MVPVEGALDSEGTLLDHDGEREPERRFAVRVLFKDRALIIDESPADELHSENNRRYLVVGDVHIGFEDKFRGEGVKIQVSTDRMIADLARLISDYEVTDLVINGDVKSSIDRISHSEWERVPEFFERIPQRCRVTLITGNHDAGIKALLRDDVQVIDSNGMMVGDNLVLHGHTLPLIKFVDCHRIVIGHVHPIYQEKGSPISGQPVWVFMKIQRSQVFKEMIEGGSKAGPDVELILMPSFNPDLAVAGYSSQVAGEERKFAPILRHLQHPLEAMVVTVDGDLIGDASTLARIL